MKTQDLAAIEELRLGLERPLPEIPTRYLYDDRGSALFEAITRLPEYYPTRAEVGILKRHAGDIVERLDCQRLADLGSGTGRKIRALLDAMQARRTAGSGLLFDINASAVEASVANLAGDYPAFTFEGVVGDFVADLRRLGVGGRRLILFLASTIGNLQPGQAAAFLGDVAAQMLPGDGFLVGLDLVKDVERLEAAYNDTAGVTAAFNLNILRAVNARFGTDFDPDGYSHRAFYDAERQWIDVRLQAERAMEVNLPGTGSTVAFCRGDEIRTEVSCKYTRGSFEQLLAGTGLRLNAWYADPEHLFADALVEREGP